MDGELQVGTSAGEVGGCGSFEWGEGSVGGGWNGVSEDKEGMEARRRDGMGMWGQNQRRRKCSVLSSN